MKKVCAAFLLLTSVALGQDRPDRGTRREHTADEQFAAAGRVALRSINEHFIGVVFDGRGENVHHLFRIWSNDALPSLLLSARDASIEYRGNELVVITADRQMYIFSLGDAATAPQTIPAGLTLVTVRAYGLNHEIRPIKAANHRAKVEASCDTDSCVENLDFYYQEDAAPASCDSGGIGSSSCSVSDNNISCSVSCMSGYYACCKHTSWIPPQDQSCKCHKY